MSVYWARSFAGYRSPPAHPGCVRNDRKTGTIPLYTHTIKQPKGEEYFCLVRSEVYGRDGSTGSDMAKGPTPAGQTLSGREPSGAG